MIGPNTLTNISPKQRKKRAKIKEEYVDPRQAAFLKGYCDPRSETFGNARRSALNAGYKENYANSIMHSLPDWLSEGFARRKKMLARSEEVLEETLNMDTMVDVFKEGVFVAKRKDAALEKIKQDSAKFVAERIGKEYWSSRTELTGKEGGPIELQKLESDLKEWAKK